jgi:hypothetical protein
LKIHFTRYQNWINVLANSAILLSLSNAPQNQGRIYVLDETYFQIFNSCFNAVSGRWFYVLEHIHVFCPHRTRTTSRIAHIWCTVLLANIFAIKNLEISFVKDVYTSLVWSYNYLCNRYRSTLTLWVRTPLRCFLDTTLCDKVYQ